MTRIEIKKIQQEIASIKALIRLYWNKPPEERKCGEIDRLHTDLDELYLKRKEAYMSDMPIRMVIKAFRSRSR